MAKNHITKVFVIEDDVIFGNALKFKLDQDANCEVTLFRSGAEFLDKLHLNPDIVTIDWYLPDMSGLELIEKTLRFNKNIVPIVISGQEEVGVVVQAYKAGARDYIVKNASAVVELQNSIANFSTQVNLRKEVEDLRGMIVDRARYQQVIGESKPILQVLRMLQKVEKTNMMVLITGESGTGKEVVARSIHYNSPRKREAFVPVNIAAIPEDLIESELFGHEKGAFTGADSKRIGKFEEANGGTIFLDEIGEMDLQLQTKLLRVLQESTVSRVGSNKEIKLDVRVLAATNRDLGSLVREGKFRQDLFYRLQGFLIHLPTLAERGNDIILLARHFLHDFCIQNHLGSKSFTREAVDSLLEYAWPGNVRELKSVVERAAILSEEPQIGEEDLIFSSVIL